MHLLVISWSSAAFLARYGVCLCWRPQRWLGSGLWQVLGLAEGQSHPGRACSGLVSAERERNVKLKLLFAGWARNQGIYSTELLMWEQSPRLSKSVVWQTQASLVTLLLLRTRSVINPMLSHITLKVRRWQRRSCYECLCRVACCWDSHSGQ